MLADERRAGEVAITIVSPDRLVHGSVIYVEAIGSSRHREVSLFRSCKKRFDYGDILVGVERSWVVS